MCDFNFKTYETRVPYKCLGFFKHTLTNFNAYKRVHIEQLYSAYMCIKYKIRINRPINQDLIISQDMTQYRIAVK